MCEKNTTYNGTTKSLRVNTTMEGVVRLVELSQNRQGEQSTGKEVPTYSHKKHLLHQFTL